MQEEAAAAAEEEAKKAKKKEEEEEEEEEEDDEEKEGKMSNKKKKVSDMLCLFDLCLSVSLKRHLSRFELIWLSRFMLGTFFAWTLCQ